MRKNSGIIRNKNSFLQQAKSKLHKKKNRFHSINKNDESFETSAHNSSSQQSNTMSSSSSFSEEEQSCKTVYQIAKKKLTDVAEIQKKMTNLSKARLTSFKEKQYQRYDQNISKLASQATNLLVDAEKCMKQMNQIQTKKQSDKKLIQNMSQSLASQIRQISRSLRQQQKQYFDTIRSYEKNTKNTAIQLSQQQRNIMRGMQQQMVQQTNDLLNNKKIDQLVKNINKLSTIYKQLNNLVIEQGSLVDRIDINIQSTLTHTKQAVIHLQAADQHASNPFADRVMKVLVIMILLLAIILGFKWAA